MRALIEEVIAGVDDATASKGVELSPSMKYGGALIPNGTRITFGGTLYRAAVDLWDT